jgi:thymidylate synthase
MSEGFPLLTTKKMAWKTLVTELLWFLRGDTNIKYLVDNGCHIWDGDAYKNYEKWFWDNVPPKADTSGKLSQEEFINKIKTDDEFAKQWGELGKIYGYQWRNWKDNIDQIANLINDLKTNPDSRRLMVNAWNPSDLPNQVLPPCHYGFQVYTSEMTLEERLEWNYQNTDPLSRSMDYFPEHLDSIGVPKRKISLMWNQRSCDLPLGIPMNIASYGLLLMLIALEVNMVPDELIGNLGDCHIYLNQIKGVKEQIARTPYKLPTLKIEPTLFEFGKPDPNKLNLDYYSIHNFELLNYQSHPKIYFPLSN